MRLLSLVSLGAAAVVAATSDFEPENFNVTEALLDSGVKPSILLDILDKLEGEVVARSTPCSLAVRSCDCLRSV